MADTDFEIFKCLKGSFYVPIGTDWRYVKRREVVRKGSKVKDLIVRCRRHVSLNYIIKLKIDFYVHLNHIVFYINLLIAKEKIQIKSYFHSYKVCLRSHDPFYTVSYFIKWVTTAWTYSNSSF